MMYLILDGQCSSSLQLSAADDVCFDKGSSAQRALAAAAAAAATSIHATIGCTGAGDAFQAGSAEAVATGPQHTGLQCMRYRNVPVREQARCASTLCTLA